MATARDELEAKVAEMVDAYVETPEDAWEVIEVFEAQVSILQRFIDKLRRGTE